MHSQPLSVHRYGVIVGFLCGIHCVLYFSLLGLQIVLGQSLSWIGLFDNRWWHSAFGAVALTLVIVSFREGAVSLHSPTRIRMSRLALSTGAVFIIGSLLTDFLSGHSCHEEAHHGADLDHLMIHLLFFVGNVGVVLGHHLIHSRPTS